jgi:hypothetical protein
MGLDMIFQVQPVGWRRQVGLVGFDQVGWRRQVGPTRQVGQVWQARERGFYQFLKQKIE